MVATGNVGLAFGLVAAAGAATAIGACVVYCASLAKPRFLAASLGFAAGVMLCKMMILSGVFYRPGNPPINISHPNYRTALYSVCRCLLCRNRHEKIH